MGQTIVKLSRQVSKGNLFLSLFFIMLLYTQVLSKVSSVILMMSICGRCDLPQYTLNLYIFHTLFSLIIYKILLSQQMM